MSKGHKPWYWGVANDIAETPRAEVEALHAELHQAFQEAILNLQVLWRQKGAFGPNDGLELLHGVIKVHQFWIYVKAE